jgi:NAD(P)-dependent dehydrogenase (short-subunit alcohol dehydrogenase family)
MVKSRFGRLDGIANLAGTAGHRLGHEEIWQIEDDEYDFVMDVNVRGAFNVISEGMRPGVRNEPGSIVYTGSMFSERGFSKGAVYSASKHAGAGLVESAAIEGGR